MLAALPERELIARMRQEGKRLRQLALGELPHLFVPIEPEFQLKEQRELESPIENGPRTRSPLAVQSLMASAIKATGFGVGCRARRLSSESEREKLLALG